MSLTEYKPGSAFSGRMGRTVGESSPAWPAPVRSTPGAPNVLYIVLDDTGYGQFGCYGSPINTPNLDRLAQNGLRYTNMHTTALCSPSRSCMLNGRNHHSNGMACITEGSTGYPGSNGAIPFENGFLSEMLLPHGYATFCVGKWHLTPAEQISAAGPYDRWPLGRGFDRYYGFLGGDTHQYYPDLVFDNHQVEPPKTPEEGYHLTVDLADKAIEFIADLKQVAPDKPFFLYFATGANHAPHQVPKEWADKYKGKFDDGWDAYREKVFARQKELGIVAPGRGAVASRSRRAAMGRTLRRRAPALRPHDGGLRRILRAHRSPDRPPAGLSRGDRPAGKHSGHGHLGQRGKCGGRAARLGQREQVLQQRARRPATEPRRAGRTRRAEILQPLPVGLDLRGQHPVSAVEARDLSRRRLRPIPRALAQGHQGQGRDPRLSTPTRSTWCPPCWSRWASRRRPRCAASRNPRSKA